MIVFGESMPFVVSVIVSVIVAVLFFRMEGMISCLSASMFSIMLSMLYQMCRSCAVVVDASRSASLEAGPPTFFVLNHVGTQGTPVPLHGL